VIQSGQVEVVKKSNGTQTRIAVCKEGDFIGEMALFEDAVRSATLCALSEVSVLALNRPTFLQQAHQDPSLAYRLMEKLSSRMRELNVSMARVSTTVEINEDCGTVDADYN